MYLLDFRIKNFRSIIDSGWIPFSSDGITVFVGQNESGKSSVLDAIYLALSIDSPSEDDYRIGYDDPKIQLRAKVDFDELKEKLENFKTSHIEIVRKYLNSVNGQVEIDCTWKKDKRTGDLTPEAELSSELFNSLKSETVKLVVGQDGTVSELEMTSLSDVADMVSDLIINNDKKDLDSGELANSIWQLLPTAIKFDEDSGKLPNIVDIDSKGKLIGDGARAANNFLKIAEINLPELIAKDKRTQATILNRANALISSDFNSFWTQTIGRNGKINFRCEIDRYDTSNAEKAGKNHLAFWINDGQNQLYPKQRSKGVSWFISFYLQLKASEKAGFARLFLLDEPGANLHSKAQGDVLKLINKLTKNVCTVVYTTHSPQLLEYSKLYRVHAVQRDSDIDDSPTVIINAHRLGTASTDTLSPLLMAMGVDLNHQEVIKKRNNVLLEELSGYYYLKAFWILTKEIKDAHFIAATGAGKLEPLANMFVGWGLHFIVVMDDDSQGREVYKSLLRHMFGDDTEIAKSRILKIPDCPGIEDAFSKADLMKFVIEDEQVDFVKNNSDFLKQSKYSKPVLAYKFYLKVLDEKLSMNDFDDNTKAKINQIVSEIASRLED